MNGDAPAWRHERAERHIFYRIAAGARAMEQVQSRGSFDARRSSLAPMHTSSIHSSHGMPRKKQSLTIEDLWSIKRVGTPTIAPDGGEAVRLTTLATGALALRWFADGKRIAFVSWVWPDLKTDKEQAARSK